LTKIFVNNSQARHRVPQVENLNPLRIKTAGSRGELFTISQ